MINLNQISKFNTGDSVQITNPSSFELYGILPMTKGVVVFVRPHEQMQKLYPQWSGEGNYLKIKTDDGMQRYIKEEDCDVITQITGTMSND
jgi:hypothetical protein